MVELQAEAYYYKIIKSKEQDISEYLPSPHMKNFAAIMERIIDKLKEDLETFKELSLEDPNNQEVKQDIINLQSKISTCQNHLNPKARGIKNNIIFATTASAKIFIAEDLKDIDSGYYKDVYDSLCFLIDNRKTSDPRKQKTLTNNKERIGIREIKNGQVRIYYQTLPNDNYYVFLITIKKADWSKRDDNKLSTRVKQIQKEYEYYSQMSQEQLEQQLEHNQPELELVIHALQKYLEVDSSKPISPIAGGSNPKVVIADKVVSSKELDEDTKLKMSSLDSRWKRVYEIAKWIYETTGSINVKLKYEIHGFQFGRWLKEQRDAYEQGKLSELQIKLLEDLEIRWHHQKHKDPLNHQENPTTSSIQEHQIPKAIFQTPIIQNKLDQKWHQKYLLAKQFYEANGHLRIPINYEINGVKLGHWIDAQRQTFKKGKMNPYRQKQLNEIGMIWAVYKPRKEKVEILDLEQAPKITSNQSPNLNETINQIYSKLQSLDQEKRTLLENMIENDDETLIQIDNNHKRGK